MKRPCSLMVTWTQEGLRGDPRTSLQNAVRTQKAQRRESATYLLEGAPVAPQKPSCQQVPCPSSLLVSGRWEMSSAEPRRKKQLSTQLENCLRTRQLADKQPARTALDSFEMRKTVHEFGTRTIPELLYRHSRLGPRVAHMREACLLWKSAHDNKGRPRLWFMGSNRLACRVLGTRGKLLRHSHVTVQICRARNCVRPEHLVFCELRTAQRLSGRGSSPVSPGDLIMIATIIRRREMSRRELAEAMNLPLAEVAQQCIALRKRRSDYVGTDLSFFVPQKWLEQAF